MSLSSLAALCREYGMPPEQVTSLEAGPERIRFTVFSMGPFGDRPYLRRGEVVTHYVIKRVSAGITPRAVDDIRAKALDDVREAVAALPFFIPDPDGVMYKGGMSDPAGLPVWLDRDTALSVIDELKENDQ